ncbi:MAG: hypothetical protein AAFP22_08080 [Planctomycetota bacterium]
MKRLLSLGALGLLAAGCNNPISAADLEGPTEPGTEPAGRLAFRSGTFGTEGYWSDTVGLGRGVAAAGLTLRSALDLGLQVDAELLPEDGSERGELFSLSLDDTDYFDRSLAAGAIVGLVPLDVDEDGALDLTLGPDQLGISCALCHSRVDGSLFSDEATGGAVGARMDGIPASRIDLGDLFALGTDSRALYPYLPHTHETVGGFPISRSGAFVRATSSEAEVDALLRDDASFPPGSWDAIPDGIGAPTELPALYDIRRAAPFGVAGEIDSPLDAVNAHVTLGLDPTTLLTVPGSIFIDRVGVGIGVEIRGEFQDVLDAVGAVTPIGGFPYVDGSFLPFGGTAAAPVGLRLPATPLEDVTGYLSTLSPTPAPPGDAILRLQGELEYGASCASCHGDLDSMAPLPPTSVAELFAQYLPTTLLARGFPYSNALDDRNRTFDDRVVLFDLLYTDIQVPQFGRTLATPRLFGLHLRERFLHDGSISNLEDLFDPARGAGAVHPFYAQDTVRRAGLVELLTTR